METQDCKDFIDSIADKYLLSKGSTWKRKRKYKHNFLTLRDFMNSAGDSITISESSDEIVGIYSIDLVTDGLSDTAKKYLTEDKLFEGITKHIEKTYSIQNPIKTIRDLENLRYPYHAIPEMVRHFIETDITFDLENAELTLDVKNSVCYLSLIAGGDWEQPIMAYFYWSEPDQSIKGFFPLGEGNTYNMETNTAYGSEEILYSDDPDDEATRERYEIEMDALDYDKIGRIGFAQFKQHIERKYKDI